MEEVKLDIGNEFGRGWNLFNPNIGLLVLAGLIGGVLSLVTCGLLGGPMTAGLLLIVRRLQKNDPIKPQVGDIFKGFDYFLQSFLFFFLFALASFVIGVILNLVPVLGQLASFAVSLFSGALVMWGIMFVVYEKMTAIDAFKKLLAGISSGAFIMPLVFGLLASLLSSAGLIACGVGVLFTYPLACCCLASAYETVCEGRSVPCEPEVIPPPQDGTQP
jgi:uncharacterized protein involved in cysteine biosynthesis